MKKSVSRGASDAGTHMAAPSSHSDARVSLDHTSPPGTPRWVKVSVIIFIALVLLVLLIELTGHGFGGPMMRMSTPMHMATIKQEGQKL